MNWRPSLAISPALVIALAVVVVGPWVAMRLRTRTLTLLAAVVGTAFTLALAAADGMSHILDPVVDPTEYWANLEVLPSGGRMLEWFAARDFLRNYSVHLKGHPPGFILLLKGLAAIGLGHPWVTGALSYLGVALMVVGVLTTVRVIVGEETARFCAPFVVVAPFAMWLGTSADAFFAGVASLGVAFVSLALDQKGKRSVVLAGLAGVTLGGLLFLTYASSSFLIVPAMVTLAAHRTSWRRRVALSVTALVGIIAVVLIFRGFGFWWLDGLKNTNWFYWHGTAQFRPWWFFVFANLGALLFAIGPAVVVGLASLRRSRIWILAGSALVCVSLATATQFTKGEVERIWVLFYPWMIPAVAVLPARRFWLATQSTLVIVLQIWLVSKW